MMRTLTAIVATVVLAGTAQAAPQPASPAAETAFLARNAQAPGVVVLPGVQYQALSSGPATGAHPTRADDVTVRYEGRFLDGTVFNTSPENGTGVTTFPLQKLIPGWIGTVRLMRPGDVWRVWIPAWLAYGAAGKETIPPDTMLVFRIELVSSAPHPPEAPPPSR